MLEVQGVLPLLFLNFCRGFRVCVGGVFGCVWGVVVMMVAVWPVGVVVVVVVVVFVVVFVVVGKMMKERRSWGGRRRVRRR